MKIISLNKLPEDRVSHNREIRKIMMLQSGDIPHLNSFSQAVFSSGQIAQGHAHEDMHEVFFVQKGTGVIRINGKPYSLISGVCVAVEPDEIHEIENTGESDLVLLYFGVNDRF